MPLNWNGDYIPSKASKMMDILGAKEIGGIGQLIYHPFRFADYACERAPVFRGQDRRDLDTPCRCSK